MTGRAYILQEIKKLFNEKKKEAKKDKKSDIATNDMAELYGPPSLQLSNNFAGTNLKTSKSVRVEYYHDKKSKTPILLDLKFTDDNLVIHAYGEKPKAKKNKLLYTINHPVAGALKIKDAKISSDGKTIDFTFHKEILMKDLEKSGKMPIKMVDDMIPNLLNNVRHTVEVPDPENEKETVTLTIFPAKTNKKVDLKTGDVDEVGDDGDFSVPEQSPDADAAKSAKAPMKGIGRCRVTFNTVTDITDKTLLVIKGFDTCALENPEVLSYGVKSSEFTRIGGYLGGGKKSKAGKSFDLLPTRLGIDTKKTAARFSNKADKYTYSSKVGTDIYRSPSILSYYNDFISEKFVKFHAGYYSAGRQMGQSAHVYMFCLFDDREGQRKAMAYKTSGGRVGDAEGLLRAVSLNKFLSLKGNRKAILNSFKDHKQLKEVNIRGIISKIKEHQGILKDYYRNISALYRKFNYDKWSMIDKFDGEDPGPAINRSIVYIRSYINALENLSDDLLAFARTPSMETLDRLSVSAGIVGGVQRIAVHGE